jgi:hypothetical protein
MGCPGIDHAADQRVADGNLRDLARALDHVAFADRLEVAEEHDADVVLFQVEHQADDVLAEVEQLAGHGVFQAVDAGDAVAGFEHGAGLISSARICMVFLSSLPRASKLRWSTPMAKRARA